MQGRFYADIIHLKCYEVPPGAQLDCRVLSAEPEALTLCLLYASSTVIPPTRRLNPLAVDPGNTLLGLHLTIKLFSFRVWGLPPCPWSGRHLKPFICPKPPSRLLEKARRSREPHTHKDFRRTFLQRTQSSSKFFTSRGDRSSLSFRREEQTKVKQTKGQSLSIPTGQVNIH